MKTKSMKEQVVVPEWYEHYFADGIWGYIEDIIEEIIDRKFEEKLSDQVIDKCCLHIRMQVEILRNRVESQLREEV